MTIFKKFLNILNDIKNIFYLSKKEGKQIQNKIPSFGELQNRNANIRKNYETQKAEIETSCPACHCNTNNIVRCGICNTAGCENCFTYDPSEKKYFCENCW